MSEYLKNQQATSDTFRNGWLRTGDLAKMDDQGYVYVTGRLKELIIKGGENIAPREIDEVLYSHPDVIEAAAFARPCLRYGETVEAAVRVRPNSSIDAQDLITICNQRLGAFKSPDVVHFMDELPKGPSGKIQRMKLADVLKVTPI
jgi:acyl-CoA synthetase (AMP-forming)/AMP-acid ligase II